MSDITNKAMRVLGELERKKKKKRGQDFPEGHPDYALSNSSA